MSEIFSWLRRVEKEKHGKLSESGGSTAIEPVPEPVPPVLELEKRITEIKPPSPRFEIREDATFALSSADRRIRHVLDPMTVVGEHYRMLRARLSQMQRERGIKTLLVTSSLPVEGKTFTACCLAGVFAQEPERRVLLIDADLRKPRAGRDIGMSNAVHSEGLSQVLRGERKAEEVILSSENMSLFLLPSGTVPDDPAELLSSPNLKKMIDAMAVRFDWVVIDSPPVIGLADATLIAPFVDNVLLVVNSCRTPGDLAKESIERIGRDRFCGVILNRGKDTHASRYYYHYYKGHDRS
jgi:protein-tyrosine kinase